MPMLGFIGSAFAISENFSVPYENSSGKRNDGLPMTMSILHPDRLHLAYTSLRPPHLGTLNTYAYACPQKTFGKQIIKHAPIRSDTALFGVFIEPVHAFLERHVFLFETSC
jgi:alkylation response protein AidB-like acyl-CoA dehydrogenase